jgi:alkylated DNA nucleotide flippase Atl1
MTCGAVARAAGFAGGARLAGRAMPAAEGLPWHRVLGLRRPGIAHITLRAPGARDLQRALLEREGVRLRRDGGVDLARYGWEPAAARARAR